MRNGMRPIHPGEVLREEFMTPMKLSASEVARGLKVPPNRVTALVNEERAVSAETAIRLAFAFDTTPTFWMNLQATYDLRTAELASAKVIAKEVTPLARPMTSFDELPTANDNSRRRARRRG
jgi:addiction module HigA family antidote